ncbi:GNAT family N-acetyltransferase [Sphingomonas koreensis]|uniref:GNAT family N-acetyltransferase n=1 Tax=Sphingomonas koreensis TaxID=93064 RepID=A0A1L6JAU5_9SPHN|nr:GNAT family N-acetyltransferase [Sphingomonas koreensis]APR52947.1 GNAT family N-acetyltransferase [Sphingomonas koreensis]RSU18140.1 GNAT family N-acetyltransferase [Sphingomonas koreensis]RSU23451.1 GNAT family N-acetyltransferase [Sphingomonas koreensis]RSU25322.1 GNAT family N-acetyltransferase [Sphingomonas koreensis]RSU38291.1 GNAT family N-acetyltransferase [Sphingomonas koreensis]
MEIREGELDDPQVIGLLEVHAGGMLANSPPGTCHFLDLSKLKTPDITFLSAWEGETLLGIGAVKQLEGTTGEIKSMRTAEAALGRGVGTAILRHIIGLARERGYAVLKLETGTGEAFDAAHALYARHGFAPCPPFADYEATDFNRFFALPLNS